MRLAVGIDDLDGVVATRHRGRDEIAQRAIGVDCRARYPGAADVKLGPRQEAFGGDREVEPVEAADKGRAEAEDVRPVEDPQLPLGGRLPIRPVNPHRVQARGQAGRNRGPELAGSAIEEDAGKWSVVQEDAGPAGGTETVARDAELEAPRAEDLARRDVGDQRRRLVNEMEHRDRRLGRVWRGEGDGGAGLAAVRVDERDRERAVGEVGLDLELQGAVVVEVIVPAGREEGSATEGPPAGDVAEGDRGVADGHLRRPQRAVGIAGDVMAGDGDVGPADHAAQRVGVGEEGLAEDCARRDPGDEETAVRAVVVDDRRDPPDAAAPIGVGRDDARAAVIRKRRRDVGEVLIAGRQRVRIDTGVLALGERARIERLEDDAGRERAAGLEEADGQRRIARESGGRQGDVLGCGRGLALHDQEGVVGELDRVQRPGSAGHLQPRARSDPPRSHRADRQRAVVRVLCDRLVEGDLLVDDLGSQDVGRRYVAVLTRARSMAHRDAAGVEGADLGAELAEAVVEDREAAVRVHRGDVVEADAEGGRKHEAEVAVGLDGGGADRRPVEIDRSASLDAAAGQLDHRLGVADRCVGRDRRDQRGARPRFMDCLDAPNRVEADQPGAGGTNIEHAVRGQAVARAEPRRGVAAVELPCAPEAEPVVAARDRLHGNCVDAGGSRRGAGQVEEARHPGAVGCLVVDPIGVGHDELELAPTGHVQPGDAAVATLDRRNGDSDQRMEHVRLALRMGGVRGEDGLDQVEEVALPGGGVEVAGDIARDLRDEVIAPVPGVAELGAVNPVSERTADGIPVQVHAGGVDGRREMGE